jgi:predicted nuclease with TOPRIM domain
MRYEEHYANFLKEVNLLLNDLTYIQGQIGEIWDHLRYIRKQLNKFEEDIQKLEVLCEKRSGG